MKAFLILEDGSRFTGEAFGAEGTYIGEVVFNTSMTGYQELLTDPTNAGQIVTMTYPLIGNYGVNEEDVTSDKICVKGLIAREFCDEPSNWRSVDFLDNYLKKNGVIGLKGIDTRELTRILREKGTMNGIITTDAGLEHEECLNKIRNFKPGNLVGNVTTEKMYHIPGTGHKVAVLDYGVKGSLLNSLTKRNCDVYVFPANAEAEEILTVGPDGILLSNGPGNPQDCKSQVDVVKKLLGKLPVFGIGLGHQILALAMGGETTKLKYGHRGGNHPVKDLGKDRTYITAQNHGYVVSADKFDTESAVVTHINMNDNTVEGIKYIKIPAFGVQFHPEVSSGYGDTGYLYNEFISMMDK